MSCCMLGWPPGRTSLSSLPHSPAMHLLRLAESRQA
jgi:hypothetical protein